jgi:gliding motility-associated-like protein
MDLHLPRFKNIVKCTILLVGFILAVSGSLKAQVTFGSLVTGDFINGTKATQILNAGTGNGPTYWNKSNLVQGIAIDGSDNVAFAQLNTAWISRIDNGHVINFPAATGVTALAIDRDDEFIYAASSGVNAINRYIWKDNGSNTSVGNFVGGNLNTPTATVATVPFITSGDQVFMNGATTSSPLTLGVINLSLAFDLTGNLYYADYTNSVVRKISIEKATPTATATASNTIILIAPPSAAVKAGDEVSGLYIPVSTYISAISGSTITLSKPTTGAINGTTTLAFITGVSDIIGTYNSTGTTLGSTAGAPTTLLKQPFGLTFDPSGNMFLIDQNSTTPRILKTSAPVSSASTISKFGTNFGSVLWGLASDANGNIYIADKSNGKILKLGPDSGPTTPTSVVAGSAGSLSLSSYTTTAGSSVITTTDITNLNKLNPGMRIRGTGINLGSTILSVNKTVMPYSITVSNPAGTAVATPYGTATSGSTSLTVSSSSNITIGQYVASAGGAIPAGTTVTAISGTTITLSTAATAALTNTQLFFYATAVYNVQTTSTTSNSSSEDGFTTTNGSYGYVENPDGIAVSHDANNPFIVYPEANQEDVRKISGAGITTSTVVPTITSFTPALSTIFNNGATITITGTNLTGATNVNFGGVDAASFTVDSPTQITAILSNSGTNGTIYVTTPGGTAFSTSPIKVLPTITAFTPTSGIAGTAINITGTNFAGSTTTATNIKIGGTAVASYTINSNTSITAIAGTGVTGTITVNNSLSGSTTSTDIFTFVTTPTNLVYNTTTQTVNHGTAGSSVTPTVIGGGITYSLNAAAPASITINATTGVINYSNTVAVGIYNLTITATNAAGNITTAYTITVNAIAPSALSYSPASSIVNFGTGGTSGTPTINTGGLAITYSLTGIVPSAISIDPLSGIINYDNTLSAGSYTVNVNVVNNVGSTTATYNVTINATAPATLVYSTASSTSNYGTAGTSVTPSLNNGGATITYSLNETVPAEIAINSSTGLISYSAALAVGTYPLSVVATNSAGNATTNYSITINAVAPSALVYSPVGSTASRGNGGTSATPTVATGGATVAYSLTGTIPSGINIDTATGIITYANTLAANSYLLTVMATNSAGNITVNYTITINPSPNAGLAALTISSGTLTPVFSSGTTTYSVGISNTVSAITFTPTVADAGYATVKTNGITVTSGNASTPIPLITGSNPISIIVTAQDASTKTYTINAIKTSLSNNANLASIAVSSGTVDPIFTQGTLNYNVQVANSVTSFNITPTVADATATITINGNTVTSGSASGNIILSVGANPITIIVSAEDGITKQTYTVTVNRSLSANADLASLSLSSGSFTPGFTVGNLNYSASVNNSVTSITVTPGVADATASVTVNGNAVTSGSASATIPLIVGTNTINTNITAQDGTTIKTYTIVITRAPSANANLTNLTLSNGIISPAFSTSTLNYTASTGNSTSSITITPVVADITATVTVNNIAVTSGSASTSINLTVGVNTIQIVVTAQSGVTKTYTIVVSRAASSNAKLSGITLSSGSLSPAFTATNASYAVSVGNTVRSIAVTPTVADVTSNLTVNTIAVISGSASGTIPLTVGDNKITIAVQAQDGTLNSYTLTVTRAPSSIADLSALGISVGALSPGFTTGNLNYAATVPTGTASVNFTPALVDATGSIQVNGTTSVNGAASAEQFLVLGNNTINITVTAQDGTTIKTYTVIVNRPPVIQTLTFPALAAVTYGTTDFAPGAISSNTAIPVTYSSSNTAVATIVAGNIHVVGVGSAVLTVSQSGDSNFGPATPVTQPLIVNQAVLTITAVDNSKTYAAAIPTLTAIYTGFVNNETSAVLTKQPTISTTAVKASPAGTYSITPSNATAANYTISYVGGVLTVNTAVLTVTAVAKSMAYGSAILPALTLTYAGFVNGDTFSGLTAQPTLTTTATVTNNAGTYPITASGGVASNYTFNYVAGVLTISKLPLIITPVAATTTYGIIPALAATYTGFINGDTPATLTTQPTIKTTATATSVVGNYPITASGAAATNYTITYTSGVLLTITPATRVFAFNVLPTHFYGDADFAPGATVSTNEAITYTSSDPTIASIVSGKVHILDVGTVTITATVASVANKYFDVQPLTQTLTINRGTQTVSFLNLTPILAGKSVTLNITSNVGLPVVITSSDPTIAAVNGQVVFAVSSGAATIAATQAGDSHYLPATYSQVLTVQDSPDLVQVHTGLSPNGDGKNDTWILDGIENYPDNKVTIINRNGIKIFQTSGYNNLTNGFDGHSNITGSMMQAGTYFYILEIKVHDETKKKTGYLIMKFN